MKNIYLLDLDDILVLLVAMLLLAIYYKKAEYDKKQMVIALVLMLPVVFFSTVQLTDVVIIDEPVYWRAFTNPKDIKNQAIPLRLIYEYKFTQLTIGTIFAIIPEKIRSVMSDRELWRLYKVAHYFCFYIISLITAGVWRKWILDKKDGGVREKIAENAVLFLLIGLPVACLMLKVCNYDSGSTYPAILGLSLIWASYKKNNFKIAFVGTLITALGVMDKWTSLPYWCICVAIFIYEIVRDEKGIFQKLKKAILGIFISYLSVILLNFFYLLYIRFIQKGLCSEINIGIVTFSFTHAARVMIQGDIRDIDYVNPQAYVDDVWVCILVISLCIIICALIIDVISSFNIYSKGKAEYIMCLICGGILLGGVIFGILSAYFIPLYISPYVPIENGYYLSQDVFTGWTYHYGGRNFLEHFILKSGYMCATIVVNYPTSVLAVLILVGIMLFIKRKNAGDLFIFYVILISSQFLLLLYDITGMPCDARYYSFSIIVMGLCSIFYLYSFWETGKIRKTFMLFILLYVMEMICYIPNVKAFSPIWVIHNKKYNESVRTGTWYAGEAMLWGEDLSLGGNRIVEDTGCQENYADKIIYTNYGNTWIDNPGFRIINLSGKEDLQYNENTYFVLSKFWLFRNDIPEFIEEVKPFDVVSFKGEIAVWIYRGDQLKEYADCF